MSATLQSTIPAGTYTVDGRTPASASSPGTRW